MSRSSGVSGTNTLAFQNSQHCRCLEKGWRRLTFWLPERHQPMAHTWRNDTVLECTHRPTGIPASWKVSTADSVQGVCFEGKHTNYTAHHVCPALTVPLPSPWHCCYQDSSFSYLSMRPWASELALSAFTVSRPELVPQQTSNGWNYKERDQES